VSIALVKVLGKRTVVALQNGFKNREHEPAEQIYAWMKKYISKDREKRGVRED
jgi:hypothetical protein